MKISHSELTQIIKEEVARYKKIKLLEQRKTQILRQLNEMNVCQECGSKYEDTSMEEGSDKMVDEILGKLFSKKKPEEKKAEMKALIMKHPTYSQVPSDIAEKYEKDESHIMDLLIDFFAQEGEIVDNQLKGIKSFVYDPKADKFVNKTKVSVPYGPMTGKKEL